MKLRLLLLTECNRACPGCCNNDWDLDALEVETDFTKYDSIMITGGEPMLYPEHLLHVVSMIREQTIAPIYVYTAKVDDTYMAMKVLDAVDGMTITLHEQADVQPFMEFNSFLPEYFEYKSLRLNVFRSVWFFGLYSDYWQIKENIEWVEDCPLPAGEVFKRWEPSDGA